jgi:tripartite-type tricarboxylate transporter receptor subunit TctC
MPMQHYSDAGWVLGAPDGAPSGLRARLGTQAAPHRAKQPEVPLPEHRSAMPSYTFAQCVSVRCRTQALFFAKEIVARLNTEAVKILALPDVQKRLLEAGIVAAPSSPEQFAAYADTEIRKRAKDIKDTNIKAE